MDHERIKKAVQAIFLVSVGWMACEMTYNPPHLTGQRHYWHDKAAIEAKELARLQKAGNCGNTRAD